MIILRHLKPLYNVPLISIEGEVQDASAKSIEITCGEDIDEWPLLDGRFKAYVHLRKKDNEIIFKADASKISSRRDQVSLKLPSQKRQVRLVYLVCKDSKGDIYEDGAFQGPLHEDTSIISAMKRIGVGALMVQHFYSETLTDNNAFRLEMDEDCEPKVHFLCLQTPLEELWAKTQDDLWTCIGKEILSSSLADRNCKYVAFCSFTRYNFKSAKPLNELKHSDYVRMTKSFIGLGGGGLALLSTQCLYTWPTQISQIVEKFCDESPVDKRKFMDDSCGRGTLAGCFATTLGSFVHELGHTFDLGHAKHGIMSRDFDSIDEFFVGEKSSRGCKWWDPSSAIILSWHQWLNDYQRHEEEQAMQKETCPLILVNDNKQVKSSNGVVIIEYRDRVNSGIVSFNRFTLPTKIVKLNCKLGCALVMDTLGNVLKID